MQDVLPRDWQHESGRRNIPSSETSRGRENVGHIRHTLAFIPVESLDVRADLVPVVLWHNSAWMVVCFELLVSVKCRLSMTVGWLSVGG